MAHENFSTRIGESDKLSCRIKKMMDLVTTHSLHQTLESLRVNEKRTRYLATQRSAAAAFVSRFDSSHSASMQLRVARRSLDIIRRQILLVEALKSALEAEQRPSILMRSENLLRIVQLTSLTAHLLGAKDAQKTIAALDVLLQSLYPISTPIPAKTAPSEFARVIRVFDGDTILLDNGWKVRYIGMDAPEMHGIHNRPEPFAIQSKNLNAALVQDKTVRLIKDRSEYDKYGRLLRYVYINKIFVNAEMVHRGAAYAYPIPPDTQQAALFQRLQQEARREMRGMWASI